MIAERWNLSREEMERFALSSHEHALSAIRAGHFDNEIVAVGDFRLDEGPRETSLEKMAGLPTLVDGGRLPPRWPARSPTAPARCCWRPSEPSRTTT
ncbi:thiolase, N-terminal domain protein [Mycobacterium kansasii]|uniref:Thiolase, N-terminal domain protein n=1 Tax=Mycobacterium kansasii TaxID=1768 RepID=A0A1V3W8K8_MYCKA|nr:thiolase, N-terminal domain protein [Mycobacterium kansasii]